MMRPAICTVVCSLLLAPTSVAGPPGPGPKGRTLAVLRILEQPVDAVRFSSERFEDAVAWLRSRGLRNIVVEWDVVERSGAVSRDTDLTLELHDVTLGEVLDWMLRMASQAAMQPGERLACHIERGVLRITTRAALASERVVRVYDVEDLARSLIFYDDAPVIAVDAGGRSPGSGAAGGSGGRTGGESIMQGGEGTRVDFREHRAQAVGDLVDVIRATIAPQTWSGQGGAGTITAFDGRLVVYQTLDVHEQIGGIASPGRAAWLTGRLP